MKLTGEYRLSTYFICSTLLSTSSDTTVATGWPPLARNWLPVCTCLRMTSTGTTFTGKWITFALLNSLIQCLLMLRNIKVEDIIVKGVAETLLHELRSVKESFGFHLIKCTTRWSGLMRWILETYELSLKAGKNLKLKKKKKKVGDYLRKLVTLHRRPCCYLSLNRNVSSSSSKQNVIVQKLTFFSEMLKWNNFKTYYKSAPILYLHPKKVFRHLPIFISTPWWVCYNCLIRRWDGRETIHEKSVPCTSGYLCWSRLTP